MRTEVVGALGCVHPGPPGVDVPAGVDPLVVWDQFLARLGVPPEQRTAKSALEAESERLAARGARRVERFDPDPPMGAGWIVMSDPEGNEFCLD